MYTISILKCERAFCKRLRKDGGIMTYRDIKSINESSKVGEFTKAIEEVRSGSSRTRESRYSNFSEPRENQFSRFTHQKNGV